MNESVCIQTYSVCVRVCMRVYRHTVCVCMGMLVCEREKEERKRKRECLKKRDTDRQTGRERFNEVSRQLER